MCEFAVSCSKSCHDYSVFPFHIVGRHCLAEILSYFTCFCFFWKCSIFYFMRHNNCFTATARFFMFFTADFLSYRFTTGNIHSVDWKRVIFSSFLRNFVITFGFQRSSDFISPRNRIVSDVQVLYRGNNFNGLAIFKRDKHKMEQLPSWHLGDSCDI